MKYFLDTEFIEGFHKPLFGKRRHFIDLISIGIYREDGKSIHLVSSEYKFDDASQWVQENVIIPLYKDAVHGDSRNRITARNFHVLTGLKNKTIAKLLLEFFGCWQDSYCMRAPEGIEIYGYYADYDWVLFCSLFGRMIDLPKGFPMYCRDLKQMLDDKALTLLTEAPSSTDNMDGALAAIKRKSTYPQQTDEHNALSDAKWNYELYKFLTK